MPFAELQSSNGMPIKLSVERKNKSGVFGRDFISGGLQDYFSKSGDGFWIVAKGAELNTNLDDVMREAVKFKLSSYPITMPETYVPGLTILLWEGSSETSEDELLDCIKNRILETNLISKPRRVPDSQRFFILNAYV